MSHIRICMIVCCFVHFAATASYAGPVADRSGQQRINGLAAAMLQIRRVVLGEPGIRKSKEPLASFLNRCLAPSEHELPAEYRARLNRYITAVRGAQATMNAYSVSTSVADRSPGNLKRQADVRGHLAWMMVAAGTVEKSALHGTWDAPQLKSAFTGLVNRAVIVDNILRDMRP